MKRDYQLVREILRILEEKTAPGHMKSEDFSIEGYDRLQIGNHLRQLYEAGFISGEAIRSSTTSERIIDVWPFDLTWQGHEFIAAARNETVWKKVRKRLGDSLLTVPFSVLTTMLIDELERQLGTK
jgi:hypothetical protein